MKRSLKTLLVTVAAAVALVVPAAPAQAANCVGVWYDTYGNDHYVVWQCDYCPPLAGLGDGRVWLVYCFEI